MAELTSSETDRAVTFNLSQDDYVRAAQLSMVNAFRKPRTLITFLLGIVGGGVIASISIADLRDDPVFIVVVLLLFLGGTLPLQYFITGPMRARRNFSQHKALQQPITFAWSQQGLSMSGESFHSRIIWNDLFDFAENRHVMLFYPAPRLMHMLPKRVLSPLQVADLRSCAKAGRRSL